MTDDNIKDVKLFEYFTDAINEGYTVIVDNISCGASVLNSPAKAKKGALADACEKAVKLKAPAVVIYCHETRRTDTNDGDKLHHHSVSAVVVRKPIDPSVT